MGSFLAILHRRKKKLQLKMLSFHWLEKNSNPEKAIVFSLQFYDFILKTVILFDKYFQKPQYPPHQNQ